MVLEKPEIERERIVVEFQKGQRAAKRGGSYFNPYSEVSQNEKYRQFEYGWQNQLSKTAMETVFPQTKKQGKFHHVAILIIGIILVGIMWYLNIKLMSE